MKKQIILPLGLLLSFVAVRASDVPAVDPSTQVDPSTITPAVDPSQAAAQLTPTVDPSMPVDPTINPMIQPIPVVNPSQAAATPVAPAIPAVDPSATAPAPIMPPPPAPIMPPTLPATAPAIPTEDDINSLLGLVTAYQNQLGVLKSLNDLVSSDDTDTPNLPNADSVRSLLNLLELHKKEADLITSLRASLASIQASLGQWDADVASLATKQKKAKQKLAKRSVDFGAIKEINKPRGQ